MNYLSHYYTELPNNHPLFVAALAIPDLTKGFSKVYNRVIRYAPNPDDERHRLIHTGIKAHYQADKNFHNSTLFVQQVTATLQSFIQVGLNRDRLRLSVIAHIAVEMMIDRQILLEHKSLCGDYYSIIEQVDERVLGTYFERFTLENEKRIFLSNFLSFRQREYLYLFEKLENIVVGMNRVYGSVTAVNFTNDEDSKFLEALSNIDKQMRYSWQEILKPQL